MKKISVVLIVLVLSLLVVGVVYAADGGAKRVAWLSGANEVPPADPDGTGYAEIRLNYGQERVCWEISFSNIDPPSAAHIHRGVAGVNGPVVVPLNPNSPGCVTASQVLIKEIIQFPGRFYVNVHNPLYPAGAIRGQLMEP